MRVDWLSGQVRSGQARARGARRTTFDFPPVDRARSSQVLGALREVSAATGSSVARVALAWQLTRPIRPRASSSVAKGREQLNDNLAAADLVLSAEHVAQLDAASELPAEYPGWMLSWQNRERRPATR